MALAGAPSSGDTLAPPPTVQRPPVSARASSTDPGPALLDRPAAAAAEPGSSPRTRSPYRRTHGRSRSSNAALLSAPAMTRAHSMPNPHIFRLTEATPAPAGALTPPAAASHSPVRSPGRVQSPRWDDATAPSNSNSSSSSSISSSSSSSSSGSSGHTPPAPRSPSFSGGSTIEAIHEEEELDIAAPRQHPLQSPGQAMASFQRSASLRRRPASPLRSLPPLSSSVPAAAAPTSVPSGMVDAGVGLSAPASSASSASSSSSATSSASWSSASSAASSASPGSSSPSLGPQKFNEAYPSLHHYASTSSFSSISSTPSSARSRSPSISSLETIEDAPDLESAAIESERIERLKLAAERQERLERGEDPDADPAARRSRSGFGRVGRERKRWSVCGAERRADLDLETIWED